MNITIDFEKRRIDVWGSENYEAVAGVVGAIAMQLKWDMPENKYEEIVEEGIQMVDGYKIKNGQIVGHIEQDKK